MVAINDILQITTKGRLVNDDVLNVFHYQVANLDDANTNLESITQTWFTQFDTQVLAHFSDSLTINSVETLNLTDGVDLYEGSVVANGDEPGDFLPVFNSAVFTLQRQTRITRNGRKSFAGIPEIRNNGGVLAFGAAQRDPIEQFLSTPRNLDLAGDASNFAILNPVIVGRTLNASGSYELDLSKINNVIGSVMKPNIRTQKSRRP